ncbi:hypothetical protein CsSME_00050958 [Camellia sinensis var. sinensis]
MAVMKKEDLTGREDKTVLDEIRPVGSNLLFHFIFFLENTTHTHTHCLLSIY